MQRRRFILSSLTAGAWLSIPQAILPMARDGTHPPLILHTLTIHPSRGFGFMCGGCNAALTPLQRNGRAYLQHRGRILGVGDRLSLKLKTVDAGQHTFGLWTADREISEFSSVLVGAMHDQDEPLIALITDDDGIDNLRVDILLNRPLESGKRLPLLGPAPERYGVVAQLVESKGRYSATDADWHPVHALKQHTYWLERYPKPPLSEAEKGPYNTVQLNLSSGLRPVNREREKLLNPTAWSDLNPAVATLTQDSAPMAYLPSVSQTHIEQLLLRGERIEARIIGAADARIPRGVKIDLSLIT